MPLQTLLIASEFPPGPGGIGTHAHQLALGLTRHGRQVVVISRQDYVSDSEANNFNTAQPFRVITLRPRSFQPRDALYRRTILLNAVKTFQPRIVVATGERALWLAATLPKRQPLIMIGHGSEFGLRGWQRRLTQWAVARADHLICVSAFTRQFALAHGFRARAMSVIPNGADASVFAPMPPEAIQHFRSMLPQGRLMLTVGNVTERKGHHVAIRALPEVLAVCPDVHYLIAGLPTTRERLVALARDIGVSDRVHFLGRVEPEQLCLLYNACDIFIMTSLITNTGDFEGYGIAAIEAALCAKPAVVAGDSGLAEAVEDGITGLVVPQNDPHATARALITLLTNPGLLRQLGENGRQRALEAKTWSHRVREYDALFRTLVGP